MAKRNDILTSIHGRQIGVNSDDELVVHGKVLQGFGITEEGRLAGGKGLYGVSSRLRLANFIQAGSQFVDSWEVHTATDWIVEPTLQFQNGTGTGEDSAAGSLLIDMSFEYPIGSEANIMPAVSRVFCPQNGYVNVKSARLARPIPPGAKYITRTYKEGSVPGSYPIMRDGLQAQYGTLTGDRCAFGTTAAAVPNTVLGNRGNTPGTQGDATGFTYGPSVVADMTDKIVPFIMGDSRNQAAFVFDGNLDSYGLQGAIVRSFGGAVSTLNASVSGDSFFNIDAIGGGGKKYDNRLAMAEFANVIICTLGINDPLLDVDLYRTYTLAAKQLLGTNKPFFIDTFYPFTSSSNLWRDTASQTPLRANLNTLNAAIRAGTIGAWIDGNFDSAAALESTRGSGLMRADGFREVTDGVTGSANTGSNTVVRSNTANFTQADVGKSLIAYRRIAFSSAVWASNQVTITATGHGMTVGSTFSGFVADANVAAHNTVRGIPGLQIVFTVVDADTLRYNTTTNPGSNATSGNVYFLLLGSLSTSTSAAPNATIKSVDSSTQVTLTNMGGGFFGTTARNGDAYLLIGMLHQDGLHAFPMGDVLIAEENRKTTAMRVLLG